ncbi:hypothetical protein SAMN06295879_0341 [Agreia bicolorata]|uniref:Uncharacterized protein n=1 Tax=Agreia bicolorata TaxID=110935 RepID=A0A1T4WWB6_9MICO|nr:hypothetical protein [Agreia bicolorata]SKA81539.1 hypothetical protein SAMN06295879_0341 [Agreia bicolorata]
MPPRSSPPPERAALERAAYGRTASPEDEARAANAARALNELDLHEAAERQALQRAAFDAADARERRAHRIRSRLIGAGGTLAAVALLAAAGAILFSSPDHHAPGRFSELPRSVAATAPPGPVGRTSSGSAASAEHWFDEPQKDSDVRAQLPDDIDAASTRAVDSSVDGWQVFVARDAAGGFCVIAAETASGTSGTSCATPDQFTSAGILMTTSGTTSITVYWDGFDLTAEPSAAS